MRRARVRLLKAEGGEWSRRQWRGRSWTAGGEARSGGDALEEEDGADRWGRQISGSVRVRGSRLELGGGS